MTDEVKNVETVSLTADIVSAYVSKNPVPSTEIPALISDVHKSLSGLASGESGHPAEPLKPAVSVKKSIQNDHIVCLEDGKRFKSLKRHLAANHGLSPDEYRERWNLSRDYPMVAPAYANARSEMAKKMGLGRKSGEAPVKRGRRKASQ